MSEDFLTKGIENDRYLKAVELIDRFEDEVYEEIRKVFDDFVKENDLFFGDGSPDERHRPTRGTATMATHRIDYTMSRVQADEEDPKNLIVNVGFEWVNPAKQGEDTSSDEALTYVYYKIKYASEENYEKVCDLTENPDILCGEEMWRNAPGIFYIPVEKGEDVKEGLDELREHLSKFGDHFGVESKQGL